ncbi:MAG: diacylglycerol kinase family protein [Candidatus Omnitrophica bacterium]|jgi:diacylglycerol kinase (ATP)|nr:diacylglycerol kinase family protein [Candidatus Omnitrophota bacterium]MDD5079185.1 diacylglycerol kinase family protein [Candidatus Omnitrophota bacterium]
MKVFRRIFKFHGFQESLRIAIKGLGYLFLYHRNMRIIFLCGITALLAGIYFRLKGIELAALCITITLVFMAEMFNTAIETMLDVSKQRYHTLIKLVKDISAAVVLIASFNAIAVGFILFARRISVFF